MSGPDQPRGLRSRLGSGEQLLGALVRLPGAGLVEMAGLVGLDFVVIDCEHGPEDLDELHRHLLAADCHGMATLVRVAEDSPASVLRALDMGAAGVIIPHVSGRAGAEAAVRAAHYPPLGRRGFARYTRAGRYGLSSTGDHLAAARQGSLTVVMIEDPTGCRSAAEILGVEGIDAVFVGPSDLEVALLAEGPPEPGRLERMIESVHDEARRLGRHTMAIVSSPEAAAAALARGHGLVVYNTQQVLTQTFVALAAARSGA